MAEKQIEINNLSKVYDNGFKALNNINLQINKGEKVALVGYSGAGKTTLVKLVSKRMNQKITKIGKITNNYKKNSLKKGNKSLNVSKFKGYSHNF